MNLLAWMAEGDLQALIGQPVVGGKQLHALLGLLELLLLQHRQVHGHIAPVGHRKRLDHMQQRQLGVQCVGQLHGMVGNRPTFFDQVNSHQYVFVQHRHFLLF